MKIKFLNAQPDQEYIEIPAKMLLDPSISLAAKGMLCMLLTARQDWILSNKEFTTWTKNDMKEISDAIRELYKAGYINKFKIKERGVEKGIVWVYSTEPGKFDFAKHYAYFKSAGIELSLIPTNLPKSSAMYLQSEDALLSSYEIKLQQEMLQERMKEEMKKAKKKKVLNYPPLPVKVIMKYWNECIVNNKSLMRKIMAIPKDGERYNNMLRIWKKYPQIEVWKKMIDNATTSDFMNAKSSKFLATFDWCISNPVVFKNIVEGVFNERITKKRWDEIVDKMRKEMSETEGKNERHD